MNWLKLFEQYGLAGLVIGVLLYMAWRRDIWIMAFVREQRDQQNAERTIWMERMSKIDESLDNHTSQAKEFHENMKEANKYQREEHNEMIKILGRMNGK